jgi:hypothetical protein
MLRQTLRHRAPPLPFPSSFRSYCDVSQALSYFASAINIVRLDYSILHLCIRMMLDDKCASLYRCVVLGGSI